MTADPRHLASGRRRSALDPEPLWWRWLSSLMNAARGFSWRRPSTAGYGREPIFRIARSRENRWVVERPGAALEHAFPDLEGVVAFIRHESEATPATVELRIGDLYVVARIDPDRPAVRRSRLVTRISSNQNLLREPTREIPQFRWNFGTSNHIAAL